MGRCAAIAASIARLATRHAQVDSCNSSSVLALTWLQRSSIGIRSWVLGLSDTENLRRLERVGRTCRGCETTILTQAVCFCCSPFPSGGCSRRRLSGNLRHDRPGVLLYAVKLVLVNHLCRNAN